MQDPFHKIFIVHLSTDCKVTFQCIF